MHMCHHSFLKRDCQAPQLAGKGLQSLTVGRAWQQDISCICCVVAVVHLGELVVKVSSHPHVTVLPYYLTTRCNQSNHCVETQRTFTTSATEMSHKCTTHSPT